MLIVGVVLAMAPCDPDIKRLIIIVITVTTIVVLLLWVLGALGVLPAYHVGALRLN